MYRIYRKILNSEEGDFEILVEETLGLISGRAHMYENFCFQYFLKIC